MNFQKLLVADYRGGRMYAVADGTVRPLGDAVLAEHAGFLTLPRREGERRASWAYVDDRSGELVVSGGRGEQRFPAAIPGEHLACDASGRYVAVTTGLGANAEAWSDVVTLVDRERSGSVRFRSRTGEPGVLIVPDQAGGEPAVVLRHREPGALEAFPLSRCLDAAPHVPRITGEVVRELADDGHGDVVDQRTGIAATATSRGLERFVVEDGVPRMLGTVAWPVPGRAYYLRLDPAAGRAVGVVRGGPASPTAWTEWTNHLVDVDLSTGRTRCLELPRGLAFRFALGGTRAAVATIHPDGDELTVIERAEPLMRVPHRTPLPPMSRPPAPGHLPWDPVGDSPAQRRSVAVDPAGTTVAVTRGGDGQLHLFHDGALDTVTVPGPLDEGGHLYWHGGDTDTIGR
ncbi:hypothetical protein GCM10007079_25720 [Nocardiopsis terrae]|uniref:Uncharacterized protein n=1 Tax=Nocardiopsis terrae TaxID=372655 RepID=A0ABR9HFL4_9ACTN|nr:hypothetical protein [Nocardiopsis terrae]MBE1457823.1 hypothetical protein [Nocardiopsis terrae]GHC84085.1 hypothetical protein GCM10007079_25720 [Nocardiopsis terrae]